jgi:CheY-like chemotaxis protein
MKKEDLPRLFTEYSQLDARANRNIEGTGLGLTITKSLVALMGGTIHVESEYGTGSTFTVHIPQRIIDETPIGKIIARNLELFRFKEINRIQNLRLIRNYMPYGRVLIVDDVETNLDVARGLMLPYGLLIDTAACGQESINKINAVNAAALAEDQSSPYDLILMDHMMPGMDGMEAVRIIRSGAAGEYGKNVPIVALTANALVGNEELFLASGFDAFISKPIDVMQLDMVLNTWVRNKQNTETIRLAEAGLRGAATGREAAAGILDGMAVAGIDLAQGTKLYASEAAYLGVLRSWHLHTPALLDSLRNLSVEKLPEYAITVHGLKGSSYGICANEIADKAQELENLAKAGDFLGVQTQNSAFIEMVELLILDLGKLLERAAASKEAKHTIPSPDTALLARLFDAAKRYKATLMEEIMTGIESNEYESGGELVTWLREQIDNLEYDAICKRLEEFRPG